MSADAINRNSSNNIGKQFLKYVSLNVLSMVGLSCYILADTIYVSIGIGTTGLTALNLALPTYCLISALGLLLGMGGAIGYSIFRGSNKGDKKQGSEIFSQIVFCAAILGVVFAIIGALFSKDIALLFGADSSVLSMTATYLKTLLIFAPAFMINSVMTCFVRNDNNPRLSMIAMLIGSFSNILLDYIFIFPMNWGIFGAAFATGLSPIISICVLSTHFIKKKNNFSLIKTKLRFLQIKKTLSLGLPSMITELSAGIIMLLFNFSILSLEGNMGVAAYGIVANLAIIIVAVFTGVAQGIQPLLSRNFGSGNSENIKLIFKYAITTVILMGIAFYVVSSCFSKEIIALFLQQPNQTLTSMTDLGIKSYFTAFFFMGVNVICTSLFASVNQERKAFVISILRGFLIVVPLIFMLVSFFKMSGVWFTIPLSEFITLIISIYFMVKYFNRAKKA